MRISILLGPAVVSTIVLAGACTPAPEPFMGSPSRGQMISHFDLALEARDLAIIGDVDGFRDAAEDLAALNPAHDLPPEIILQLGPMRWEAREAARASSVEEAALGAAEIARTCGDCHEANEVALGDRFTLGGPPPSGDERRHMAGLAWAMRLMWDGLVGPSHRTWYVGAEGLIELGALPERIEDQVPEAEVVWASNRLRKLGQAATSATTADHRVRVLGDIWGTCARCHSRTARPPQG